MTITPIRNKEFVSFSHWTWQLLDADETGEPISNQLSADRTVHVFGTFDSGTVTIQGSNQAIPSDWQTLHDASGANLAFTAAGIETVLENPLWIRAVMSGSGVTGAVTVILVSKGK